jgi:hypothetical protein
MKKPTNAEVIEITKQEYIEMLVADYVPTEGVTISLKKKFDTACWYFNRKFKKHFIYFGDKAMDMVVKKSKLGTEYFVKTLLHHEMAHACFTSRDHKGLQAWLKENGVPFTLYNLFEDARIEYLWRVKTGREFKSDEFINIPDINKDSNANTMFFVYLRKDGKHRSRLAKMKRVREYYERIVDCATSEDMRPIMLEWMKEFPETKEELDDLKSQGFLDDDLEDNSELEDGGAKAQKLDENSEDIAGEKSEYKDEFSERDEVEELSNIDYDYSTADTACIYNKGREYEFNKDLGNKLLPIMEKIFKSKKRKICQSNPTNRVNIRNYMNSRFDKMYRKKAVEAKAKMKINLIIDCSGSMEGKPIEHARTLAYMLSCFARKGVVDGNIILTGAEERSHQTMTLKLPLSDEEISHIYAYGDAEGIAGTVNLTKKLLKHADYNFCFTDGNISDNPLSNTKGLNLLGMYVGRDGYDTLSKWFELYLSRETLEDLVQKLIIKL